MDTIQPETLQLVLNVFYNGLINGIISKQEIIEWTDSIIKNDAEPDYFLIELSLCNTVNDLVTVINRKAKANSNVIEPRVLFGIAYNKLLAGTINIKQPHLLFSDIMYRDFLLSDFERAELYDLDEDYCDIPLTRDIESSKKRIFDNTLIFLQNYKEFSLNNCDQWQTINSSFEINLAPKIEQHQREIQKWQQEYEAQQLVKQKQDLIQKRLIYMIISIITILSIIDVIISRKIIMNNGTLSKFQGDLYAMCLLFLALIVSYYIMKGVAFMLGKVIKI